jgi:hypothetical protein
MESASLRQRAAFLERLFDADVPCSEMAQLLVALSLTQKEPEVSGLAVDVLIELIRDGRCVGPDLGHVLGTMAATGLLKLNRLAKHLETVARASLLHTYVCARMLQLVCAALIEPPRDLHHVLAPLLEWLAALEQGVTHDVRPLLEKVTTGKSGALAKSLLKLRDTSNKRRAVLLEALEGRLQRARRWASA